MIAKIKVYKNDPLFLKSVKEKNLRAKIIKWLKDNKIDYWANHSIGFGNTGLPDLNLLYKGKLIGLELKTEKGRIRESQMKMQQIYHKHNLDYIIIRPSNIDDINKIIERIDNE